MRVAVTGSGGLIGSALAGSLRASGHEVLTVVRREPQVPSELSWDPDRGALAAHGLDGVDAVVHLAGAGLGDRRWTPQYKRLILESRVQSTTLLAQTLAGMKRPPQVLLTASAVGFYGDTGDEAVDEASPRGNGFLADVCVAWEDAAAPAVEAGIRVCQLRSGIVASRHGGAFARLLPLFRLGLGGRLGSGRQYQSWIALSDEVGAITFLLTADVRGPVNLTAPHPLPQAEVARALGRAI
ncbi:MAG: TIGR01777 family oxidoreductase, partial [Mycobacteriales bacterium]